MTETTINVISVQQSLQDLSDVRDIDRYELLLEIAKETKFDKETVLAFDCMYDDYHRAPNVNSFADILLNYVLKDKKYIPTVKLDLAAKANDPWKYYIPKDVPQGTMRAVLPEHRKIIIEGTKPITLIAPQGQIVDILNINKKEVLPILLFILKFQSLMMKNILKHTNMFIVIVITVLLD